MVPGKRKAALLVGVPALFAWLTNFLYEAIWSDSVVVMVRRPGGVEFDLPTTLIQRIIHANPPLPD